MNISPENEGQRIFARMKRLWPICRSITGEGVRETLSILREDLPELVIHEVPTGERCFDWVVPKEWVIRDAYVIGPDGSKVVDFAENNLHVVGYSEPVEQKMELDDLQAHLHSLPEQPEAIPFVTSYYAQTWGFCLPHEKRESLRPGLYDVRIDSELKDGSLTYGEILLPGRSEQEVLLSTYICHPSMANNELSGPSVTTELAVWLQSLDRRYSYRILYVPETIGAICYISRHLEDLKEKVLAGYVITCVGDERDWSLMPSRNGNTLSDDVARHVLEHLAPNYKEYSYLDRGSDERQYCSPGVDLPISSIMRSKYLTYPEYHTSLDNLDFVTPVGLGEAFSVYQRVVEVIETNCVPVSRVLCEPKMSDRGLRPTLGTIGLSDAGRTMMNLLAYADGATLLEIARKIGEPFWELRPLVKKLAEYDLLQIEEVSFGAPSDNFKRLP